MLRLRAITDMLKFNHMSIRKFQYSEKSEYSLVEEPAVEFLRELGWETDNCFHEKFSTHSTVRHETTNEADFLCHTRDLLLPKLISGEVDVNELDIEIGAQET